MNFIPVLKKVLSTVADIKSDNIIGICPKTGKEITTGSGKFGNYIKLATDPAKFSNIPKHISIKSIDINTALSLLAFPKKIGIFQNNDIIAAYGKNGGYFKV